MRYILSFALWLGLGGICLAGPAVALHPKAASVKIWNDKGVTVQEFADPKQIKILQDAFRNAKRIGDSGTKQVRVTHKIDFADRWLMDIDTGEIVVLSKVLSDVYQLEEKDAVAVRELIKAKAEPEVKAEPR